MTARSRLLSEGRGELRLGEGVGWEVEARSIGGFGWMGVLGMRRLGREFGSDDEYGMWVDGCHSSLRNSIDTAGDIGWKLG